MLACSLISANDLLVCARLLVAVCTFPGICKLLGICTRLGDCIPLCDLWTMIEDPIISNNQHLISFTLDPGYRYKYLVTYMFHQVKSIKQNIFSSQMDASALISITARPVPATWKTSPSPEPTRLTYNYIIWRLSRNIGILLLFNFSLEFLETFERLCSLIVKCSTMSSRLGCYWISLLQRWRYLLALPFSHFGF